MRLSFDEIRELTVGAVSIFQDDSRNICFERCTGKQITANYAFSETLGMRSRTTTGVRLDFHTNSKTLKFKSLGCSKMELLIDGVLRERFTPSDNRGFIEECVTLCDAVGEAREDVRVTLAFPSHEIGKLEYAELDDGAYFTPHRYSKKMLFIGDSITQGYNSYFDTLSYAWLTSLYFNANSVINGIGGAFYHVSTFDKPDFDPDIVIIAYGTNDWGRYPDAENMKEQVAGYLDLVKAAYGDKDVFVISPIWRANNDGDVMGKPFDSRRKMIENEAALRGFIAVDGLSLVPALPQFYADTYLHPNDLGFSMFAGNLIKVIEENIK